MIRIWRRSISHGLGRISCGTFAERQGWHGCQMPERLLGRIVEACSNEGDLVLDPFTGSGTTLTTAKKLGRRYLGFEMSGDYTDYARKRLARIKKGDPLDGAEDSVTSAPSTSKGKKLADRQPRRRSRRSTSQLTFDLT